MCLTFHWLENGFKVEADSRKKNILIMAVYLCPKHFCNYIKYIFFFLFQSPLTSHIALLENHLKPWQPPPIAVFWVAKFLARLFCLFHLASVWSPKMDTVRFLRPCPLLAQSVGSHVAPGSWPCTTCGDFCSLYAGDGFYYPSASPSCPTGFCLPACGTYWPTLMETWL